MKRPFTVIAISLAALALSVTAQAETVAYTRLALHDVVSQLDQKYGLNIVLKGSLLKKQTMPITFSVGDPDTSTTRLQIMNAFANAAGVDFQKGFVVSKIGPNEVLPPVKIDTDAFVVFKSKTISVRDAINIVAGTDNATVQVSPEVTGNVTFSATTLRATQAAREIAQQTQTVWRAYYALTPDNVMADTPHPFTYFDTPPAPAPASATTPVPAPNAGPPTPLTPDSGVTVIQPPFQYVPSMGYGYGNNGFGPYGSPYDGGGYNPYGSSYDNGGYDSYGGFGGGGFGGGYGGVTILPGTGGYGPFGGYGGSPITFP